MVRGKVIPQRAQLLANKEFIVEVVYALPTEQYLISVQVKQGTTVLSAVESSGILQKVAGLDLSEHKLGIFGKYTEPGTVLQAGDRIEIYRPLQVDPKLARIKRIRPKSAN